YAVSATRGSSHRFRPLSRCSGAAWRASALSAMASDGISPPMRLLLRPALPLLVCLALAALPSPSRAQQNPSHVAPQSSSDGPARTETRNPAGRNAAETSAPAPPPQRPPAGPRLTLTVLDENGVAVPSARVTLATPSGDPVAL